MAALKKRYYQKIDEEVYSAILDNGMSLSIITFILMVSHNLTLQVLLIFLNTSYLRMSREGM